MLIMASLVACVLFTASVLSPSNMFLDSEGNLDWTSARDDDDYCEDTYEGDPSGCNSDPQCEWDGDDDECDEIDDDDDDDDEDYCEQYDENQAGCDADSQCEWDEDECDDYEGGGNNGGGNNGGGLSGGDDPTAAALTVAKLVF